MFEFCLICEYCNMVLLFDVIYVCICLFECMFCVMCVDGVFGNVCLNCGGGFMVWLICLLKDWKNGNFLGKYLVSMIVKYCCVDLVVYVELVVVVGVMLLEKC